MGLAFIGYVTYVLYPAMPPWMSAQFGHMPSTTRIIDQVWKHLHLQMGVSLSPAAASSTTTSLPCRHFHGAYPMLICLFFWKGSSARKRVLLAAYPICMAFSLAVLTPASTS